MKKMRDAFCTHIFSTKNVGIFEILRFEILTKRKPRRRCLNGAMSLFIYFFLFFMGGGGGGGERNWLVQWC